MWRRLDRGQKWEPSGAPPVGCAPQRKAAWRERRHCWRRTCRRIPVTLSEGHQFQRGGNLSMQERLAVPMCVLMAVSVFSPLAHAQARLPGAVYDFDKKGEKPGPAPVRDISGVWEPASGVAGGIQGKGAAAMESCKRDPKTGKYAVDRNAPVTDTGYATPDCLKPDVEPPYTPLGRETVKAHIPVEGYRMVPDALTNDPILKCDPGSFPPLNLHSFRTSEILQTPTHMVILYKFQHRYRQIWTDGRELPKDPENPAWGNTADALPPESRWWGYSVGK